jgi:hypothetical protein
MEDIKKITKTNIEKPKKGPKPKYVTDEEKKQANRDNFKRYYERNREKICQQQIEKYSDNKDKIKQERKHILDVYKMYIEGKLIKSE